MSRTTHVPSNALSWRIYTARDGKKVERQLRNGEKPTCPGCHQRLVEEEESRLSPTLILDATSYDLACRACRRFWVVVHETHRSLQLIRMRRLAAAVKGDVPPRRRPASVTDFIAVMHP